LLIWWGGIVNEESAIKAFFTLVGGAFLVVAIEKGVEQKTIKHPSMYVTAALGALIFFAGFFWAKLPISPRLSATAGVVATDFRFWLGVVFIVWAYQAITGLIHSRERNDMRDVIQRDIVPFRMALQKWVIPRHLTPEQITAIGEHLRKFPPQPVSFVVNRHDDEAARLRGDIANAIVWGRWTIASNEYEPLGSRGIRITSRVTDATNRRAKDPRNPRPDDVLQEAFRQAGVAIEGGGSSSGPEIVQDTVTIEIGARRNDFHAATQPWKV
jgi:hypothetical protein